MAGLTSVMSDRRARLESSPLRHLDLILVGSVLAINALGLLMIYSATRNGLGGATGPTYYLKRQLVFVVLGDRKSTRLNSSHVSESRMPSSA